jgi:penicillin amidase
MAGIHTDVQATRAAATLPQLVALLEPAPDERSARAIELLRRWDHRATIDSAAAAFYEVLFVRWTQAVAAERLPGERSGYLAAWLVGLAARLLTDDEIGWFRTDRRLIARRVLVETVDELETRLGPDPGAWRWGDIHQLTLRHPLSGRGELGELLDKPAVAVPGDLSSVNNSGFEGGRIPPDLPAYQRNWEATSGAGYRLVADLGVSPPEIWTITGESQSGHPGSPHWNDQLDDFVAGRYQRIPMDEAAIEVAATSRLTLEPEER